MYRKAMFIAKEAIVNMGGEKTTTVDFFDSITEAHPQWEELASDQLMGAQLAVTRAIQEAAELGMIEIIAVSKREGPVFRRSVRARRR